MRKFILGAGAALAFAAGSAVAQTSQAPAPVVPLGPVASGPVASDGGVLVPSGPVGAPIVGLDGGPTGAGGGGGSQGYVEGSFLLMFVSSSRVNVPTLTTGTGGGVLGVAGTRTVAGNNSLDYPITPGFRVAGGQMIAGSQVGLEAVGTYIGRQNERTTVGPTSAAVLARPFYDPTLRRETARIIAAPGAFAGGFVQDSSVEAFGFEVNPYLRASQGGPVALDLIAGFRYFQFLENLNIYDTSRVLAGGTTSFNGLAQSNGATVATQDRFGATNIFYGGQIGARTSYRTGGFFLDLTGKIALGGVFQRVNAAGATSLVGGQLTQPATTNGGFLTAGNRAGSATNGRFAVLPEVGFQLGYQVSSSVNIFAGYSLLYLSSVARPGEQLNRNFASNTLATTPGFVRPTTAGSGTTLTNDDLFIHGFNFGTTFSY